jgi:hypothetical protein
VTGSPHDADAPARDPRLDALLAEYATLRQESLGAIGHRVAVMNFTFAAVSLLVAGLLTNQVGNGIAALAALVFVPQIAKAGLMIWLGEYQRSQRAGRWIAGLEERINRLIGEPVMTWESGLGDRPAPDRPAAATAAEAHMTFPYIAVVVLLLGTGYLAAALGVYFTAQALDGEGLSTWVTALIAGGVALIVGVWEVVFLGAFRARWAESKLGPRRP